jgi:hypothetical protein
MADLDDWMRDQQKHIDTTGWSVTHVLPTHDEPASPFAYTVGLTPWGSPELVIAGLHPETAHALLNDLAGRVFDQAARFTHGQRIPDLLAGYDAIIVEGPATDALHPGAAQCPLRRGQRAPPAGRLARPRRALPLGSAVQPRPTSATAARPALATPARGR